MYTLAAKKELGELVHKRKEKNDKELRVEEDKGNCSNSKPPSPYHLFDFTYCSNLSLLGPLVYSRPKSS